MSRLDERIGAALDGLRIDRAVALVADVSRSAAARLLKDGNVRLDRTVVTSGARRVSTGETLSVELVTVPDTTPGPDPDVEFRTVFEDPDVVIVDKPPDLVVHPGAGNDRGTLVNGLLARYPEIAGVGDPLRPGIVHRLDRSTSGLLVVARSEPAYRSLSEQLRDRTVERVYSCLVWGHVEAPSGLVDAPVGRSKRNPMRMTVTVRGRAARTRYEVESRYLEPAAVTLLACRLETGRTHQIRVHMRAIGHAVVGDKTYGQQPGTSGPPGASLRCDRPFLHSRSLGFSHPMTGEVVRAESPLPEDLTKVIAALS